MDYVDIVMPTYKPERFEQALKSAIGQTYPNIKIYISDNCPTDEIKNIVGKYDLPNIYYQRSSVYCSQNYVNAFLMGDSPFIKPLFDDDILHPFCVELIIKEAKNYFYNSTIGLAFSASAVIDINNDIVKHRAIENSKGFIRGDTIRRFMLGNLYNPIGEFSTVLFKREIITKEKKNNLFNWRQVDCNQALPDVAFFLNICEDKGFYYHPEILSYFRLDRKHNSDSNQEKNPNPLLYSKWFDLFEKNVETRKDELTHFINLQRIKSFSNKFLSIHTDEKYKRRVEKFSEILKHSLNKPEAEEI
jgi:glycosyltransferase involved in cell wall biosynthesis